ncbi:hypothetical protein [Hymenobacter armeniacus]|uniref:Outer membrane protein beta-barrel domain-containing protein n=1 Tax=Hymenobacter armeniacus TaxID=2771358 RepID=A0ABR8JU67_9BACT|nr:hypothetical protein [Hymenobacter armeniacus]MBD2722072.1 hypothetical protein [Hymenobacter armeniacus]
MRKLLLGALLLVCGAHPAYSQTFEPGYLVLQRGDTLRGEVENAFWEEPAKTVRFRPTATARPVTYTSQQLRSLGLASGRLLRHELLTIDMDAETRLPYLSHRITHRPRPDSVMADVLVQGPATLLGIVLNETRHYFVQRPGQPRLELAAHNYLLAKDGRERIADANNYKSQLLLYFGDCEAVTSLLSNTSFTEEGLQRLVRAYNRQCSGVALPPEAPAPPVAARPHVTVRLGLMAGVRYNSMRLKTTDGPSGPLDGHNADGRPHALGGLYADVVAGGRRLAIHTDLQVSQMGNAQATAVAATPTSLVSSYQWRATHIVAHFGLRGFFPMGPRAQVVVGGGYEINSFWGSTSEFRYGGEVYEFVYPFHGTPLPYLEAGLSRNRWSLMLNGRLYEPDYFYAYPTTYNYTNNPWSLALTISYRLNADSDALPK